MTPDKIYIPENISKSDLHCISSPDSKGRGIEYIRKDALLKLLKPEMDIAYSEDYERGCIDGRNGFKEELIAKIESL